LAQDIRTQADNLLAEFLKEIRCAPHVEFGRMVNILIPFATSQGNFLLPVRVGSFARENAFSAHELTWKSWGLQMSSPN